MLDCTTTTLEFLDDVAAGLAQDPKQLPCKYLYDTRGSQLFERICSLDEYYLTRTELGIMRRDGPEISAQIGPGAMLIEYGSGSSVKTRLLLDELEEPAAYTPVDISAEHLSASTKRLAERYPNIEILPVCADFTSKFSLPVPEIVPRRRVVYFPGSTIGNFQSDESLRLLSEIASLCDAGGGLVIGIDLRKDVGTIEAAYNDRDGITAEFNLNLLVHINRELGANFDVEQFAHHAEYNPEFHRVEIFLISTSDQLVTIGDDEYQFGQGEMVCTEYSYKYCINDFAEMAAGAGLTLQDCWTDDQQLFAVLYFEVSHDGDEFAQVVSHRTNSLEGVSKHC